jgi:hypothetical protein
VEPDGEGEWQVAGTPLFQSEDFIGHLDAHPYDRDRLVWSGAGVFACAIDDSGKCGAGTWTISDATLPKWSRRGLFADPDVTPPRASLYYRDLTVSGSRIVIREMYDDGASSSPAPFSGFLGADAY